MLCYKVAESIFKSSDNIVLCDSSSSMCQTPMRVEYKLHCARKGHDKQHMGCFFVMWEGQTIQITDWALATLHVAHPHVCHLKVLCCDSPKTVDAQSVSLA